MDKEEILVYLLWVLFLLPFFVGIPFGGVIQPVAVILAIWVSNRLKDKKRGRILSWVSFALLIVTLVMWIIPAIRAFLFLRG